MVELCVTSFGRNRGTACNGAPGPILSRIAGPSHKLPLRARPGNDYGPNHIDAKGGAAVIHGAFRMQTASSRHKELNAHMKRPANLSRPVPVRT